MRASEAAQELLARMRARDNLQDFITYINPEYIVSEFSRAVCEALDEFLDDMQAGKRPVLILGAPPQHGKSDIVSRYLPAYMFGLNPNLRVAGLSYGKDLASDMNRDVQRIMLSDSYRTIFPDSSLNKKRAVMADVEAKRNSETFEIVNSRGSYISQGVGGPLTGKKVDCLVAGTMIDTDIGRICIEDLHLYANSCKIVSYNGEEQAYGKLKAFASSTGLGIYRVTTKSGRVFESTGDHKIYTARGYTEASKLAEGDVLVCSVQNQSIKNSGRLCESAKSWGQRRHPLFAFMRNEKRSKATSKRMRDLQQEICSIWKKVLFKEVSARARKKTPRTDKDVRNVYDKIHGSLSLREVPNILRERLCKQGARSAYDGQKQPTLQGWKKPLALAAALCKSVQVYSAKNIAAGFSRMCDLWSFRCEAGGSSHGRMGEQQRVIEFSNALCETSQRSPQADGFGTVRDYVVSVERVFESATVYDIQVEGDANFFANGVLVHNCGIIDDPIKNAREALSKTVKDSVWNWYTSTFLTRLSKNSGQIIMATRWAVDDLSGKVADKIPNAKVLAFKAISDDGQALVPELHPIEKLLETKAITSEYFWSAMYQQAPVVMGGGLFKTEWWQYYRAMPRINYRMIYADTAQKTKEQNDYSVFQCWGMGRDGRIYLLDMIRGKWEAPQLLIQAKAFWEKHKAEQGIGALRKIKIEDKSSGTGLIQQLTQSGVPVEGIPRGTDKVSRALDVAPQIQVGNVYLPESAPWLSDYLTEFTAFPNASHDDMVDPTMDAINDMLIDNKAFDYSRLL